MVHVLDGCSGVWSDGFMGLLKGIQRVEVPFSVLHIFQPDKGGGVGGAPWPVTRWGNPSVPISYSVGTATVVAKASGGSGSLTYRRRANADRGMNRATEGKDAGQRRTRNKLADD